MIVILFNALTILVGGAFGLLIKNNLRREITDAIMVGIGFFTVYLGITGVTAEINSLVYLLAILLGGVVGTVLKMDDRINRLAAFVEQRFSKGESENRFASGFAGFFIVSCVGAYTILASFKLSLGDGTMMYTKAVMDLVVSMAMTASLGAGVLFSCVPVVLYEALLLAFAGVLSPLLSESMIGAISCTGAILTIAIGTNVAGVTKFKVVNYLPALVFAPIIARLFEIWA